MCIRDRLRNVLEVLDSGAAMAEWEGTSESDRRSRQRVLDRLRKMCIRDRILEDNTHGYTDFHCQSPSIETTVGGPHGPEVVKADYVIDYTRWMSISGF